MLVAFIMGFAAGLPLLLTIGLMQAWMKDAGVDLTVIGLMNLVQIPYTWKFIWAPLLDRYTLPLLGRRRGWLIIAQLALMASIAGLGLSDPLRHLGLMALMAWGWAPPSISTAIAWECCWPGAAASSWPTTCLFFRCTASWRYACCPA